MGEGHGVVNKIDKTMCPYGTYILVKNTDNKQK